MKEVEITIYVWKGLARDWETSAITGDLETAFAIVNFHHMRGEQTKMVTYFKDEDASDDG